MSQENVEIARRNWELWSKGADDEVARRLAPDVEWQHQIGLGSPMEGVYRGREEVLELSAAIRDAFGCGASRDRGRARPLLHRSPDSRAAFISKAEGAARP